MNGILAILMWAGVIAATAGVFVSTAAVAIGSLLAVVAFTWLALRWLDKPSTRRVS